MTSTKFTGYLGLVTIFLVVSNLIAFSYLKLPFGFPFIAIYFFLVGLNLATYFILARAAAKRPTTYVTVFMGVFGIKMFSALIFLILIILTHKEFLKPIASVFLFSYISYFILQVWASIRVIKNRDSSDL